MSLRDQLVAKNIRDCKYFTGIQNEACGAGVKYASLRGEDYSHALPCALVFSSIGSNRNKPVAECKHRCVMTREEAEKSADAQIADMANQMRAMDAAHSHAAAQGFKKGNGGQGLMPCPIPGCTGVLRYRVAGINGHMAAACTVETCVRWME